MLIRLDNRQTAARVQQAKYAAEALEAQVQAAHMTLAVLNLDVPLAIERAEAQVAKGAEKFNTPTHLNEIRQMDIEQAFADDETVMNVLEKVLVHILTDIKTNCSEELKILKQENLKVPKTPFRRVTYTEAIEILQKAGEEIKWGDDLSKPQEKLLMELVGEQAFFIERVARSPESILCYAKRR